MVYKELKEQYANLLADSTKKYNSISVARLLLVIFFLIGGYYYFQDYSPILLALIGVGLVVFIVLVRIHEQLRRKKEMEAALLEVNVEEYQYLNREAIPFADGAEFEEHQHPYSYDIDIFGPKSLFHQLNRTGTFMGKARLANLLKKLQPLDEITLNQDAVKELNGKLDFRQKMLAIAKINRDSEALYKNIQEWVKMQNPLLSPIIGIAAYLLPLLFFGLCIAFAVTQQEIFSNAATYLFIGNLVLLYSQLKKIKQQILNADRVKDVIRQYGLIIKAIEDEKFESAKLKALQAKLQYPTGIVSQQLGRLSSLINSLDAIQNLLGAVIFNGLFLYHLHVLKALLQWKSLYAKELPVWLEVIAEIEALNSLSNFSYNNPNFAFPTLNQQYELEFEELGHPLIDPKKRVDNNVSFSQQAFILLTGSNMSGKSTFLRALGVNMVLAGVGSVVCAKSAKVHPLEIFVSMRLSDSLSDSESYFYAEIKRIKEIMTHLEGKRAFVLLDEILRGTNSDDKRNGTIEVVKKMVEKKAIGAIATHDLEVCNTTDDYPNYLTNKCFEVAIVADNLHFDYKLHDGVSKNKSATFLMKKMEII